MDWLWHLFDPEGFTPRAGCGVSWEPWMVAASRLANIAIFVAYIWIPASLFTFWSTRRKDRKEAAVLLLFVAFILLCGITHLCDFLAFDWPAYRFFLVVDSLTAVVSLLTAVLLPSIVRRLARLPSHEELFIANESLATYVAKQHRTKEGPADE